MVQYFQIPGTLPSLNEANNASRTSKYVGAKLKKDTEAIIILAIKAWKIKPVKKVKSIDFYWYEPNKKRDPDNIFSAKKFILDALQTAGIIPTDSWKLFPEQLIMQPYSDLLKVDKDNPHVRVEIYSEESCT